MSDETSSLSESHPTSLSTPPLLLFLSPMNYSSYDTIPEKSFSLSAHIESGEKIKDCEEIEESYWLRKNYERKSPLFFEEAEEIREIQRRDKRDKIGEKENEKKDFPKRERKMVDNREKRRELLREALKWKIWQKLDIKSRYPKRECVKLDLIGKEDAKIVSELFGESESFSSFNHHPSSPFTSSLSSSATISTTPPRHHTKFLLWKLKIISEQQMEPWFASLLRCYKMRHYAEVQLHSGVLTASPTPMEVSLVYSKVLSWMTSDCLGGEVIERETKSCGSYYLKISFKISCSKISYESDSE